MFRFYRETVELLYFVLAVFKDKGINMRHLQDHADSRNWRDGVNTPDGINPSQLYTVLQKFRRGNNLETIQGTIEQIEAQLLQHEDRDSSYDLVNLIIKILELPYPRNAISGKAYTSLRKALLLPEEMNKIKLQVKKRELSCGGCGHPFVNMEMTTISHDADATEVTLLCTRCVKPEMIACARCTEGSARIPDKLQNTLNKSIFQCDEHKPKKEEEKAKQEEVVIAGGRISDIERIPEPQPLRESEVRASAVRGEANRGNRATPTTFRQYAGLDRSAADRIARRRDDLLRTAGLDRWFEAPSPFVNIGQAVVSNEPNPQVEQTPPPSTWMREYFVDDPLPAPPRVEPLEPMAEPEDFDFDDNTGEED